MQSWETRMGRSLRVVGLAREGVVAFFSNFGSMVGSSSAYGWSRREGRQFRETSQSNHMNQLVGQVPSTLNFKSSSTHNIFIEPSLFTLTSRATSSESQNPGPAISMALSAHLYK
jgi:hypothetical protein